MGFIFRDFRYKIFSLKSRPESVVVVGVKMPFLGFKEGFLRGLFEGFCEACGIWVNLVII